jgi:hypothetical protein
LKTGIFQNGGIPVCCRHRKREFFKMAEFPFATGFENGSFSKWRNSRFLSALKTRISVRVRVSSFEIILSFASEKIV